MTPHNAPRTTTPLSWQCFTASHICRNRRDASASENVCSATMRSISSPPLATSITIQKPLRSSIHSNISMTFEWPRTRAMSFTSSSMSTWSCSVRNCTFEMPLTATLQSRGGEPDGDARASRPAEGTPRP